MGVRGSADPRKRGEGDQAGPLSMQMGYWVHWDLGPMTRQWLLQASSGKAKSVFRVIRSG